MEELEDVRDAFITITPHNDEEPYKFYRLQFIDGERVRNEAAAEFTICDTEKEDIALAKAAVDSVAEEVDSEEDIDFEPYYKASVDDVTYYFDHTNRFGYRVVKGEDKFSYVLSITRSVAKVQN